MEKTEVVTDAELRSILAENVARIRRKMNLSQEVLAAQAGFHRTYISQIEQQRKNVSLDSLAKLAAGLNVLPHLLLRRAPPIPRPSSGD